MYYYGATNHIEQVFTETENESKQINHHAMSLLALLHYAVPRGCRHRKRNEG
jgi:hypothetical protein